MAWIKRAIVRNSGFDPIRSAVFDFENSASDVIIRRPGLPQHYFRAARASFAKAEIGSGSLSRSNQSIAESLSGSVSEG